MIVKTDPPTEQLSGRRQFVKNTLGLSAAAFLLNLDILSKPAAHGSEPPLTFEPVHANTADTITVPKGYRWQTLISWGDPLWSNAEPFDETTRGTSRSQQLAFGDNNDGMWLFEHEGRSIIAVNHEYVSSETFFANGQKNTSEGVRKAQAAHGISVIEVRNTEHHWRVVTDSKYNRRITAETPMEITGPARGHPLLRTEADPTGTHCLGTWNNCGSGKTPWGTYLTCEENFNGYFASSDKNLEPSVDLRRYGIGVTGWGYGWEHHDQRFDISRHPNEPNRVGYVVEVDPLDPSSIPRKLTALGRLKHENAELVIAENARLVVYMGDDEAGEFLYRYLSDGVYDPTTGAADLLQNGSLWVAKFDDDGHGHWLELSPKTTDFASRAEICVHTRQAASLLAATTMDRPEWIAAHPDRAELYCALTNNKGRGRTSNLAGDPMRVGGPNPRAKNRYGQILRWTPANGDHTASTFEWDLFIVAGNPLIHDDARAGSSNITTQNMFNSPDSICFDSRGGLWIQTDGSDSDTGHYRGQGNNQMLYADPNTGEIKRFMVGPRGCELTGFCWSGNRDALFVGIQHPGARGSGHWPGGGNSVPRSSVVVITRDDGESFL